MPVEKYKVDKPVFFGGALNDVICIPAQYEQSMPQYVSNLTIRTYDASHWLHLEKKDEVNKDIKEWLQTLNL